MVQINFARREVNCKIVFYGPGLSGKTTNLEIIHKKVPDTARGALTSIATEQDRTLFFDFMPLDLGQVAGMKTKFFLYTVPGQVYYNSTRKLVLQGADGIAFIGDSDPNRMQDNLDSIRNLEENLKDYGVDLRKIPFVIQYNKRDLPGAIPVAELNTKINPYNAPCFEAVAVRGDGVMATLKGLAKIVIDRLNEDYAPGKTAAGVSAPARTAASGAAPGRPVVTAPPAARPAAKVAAPPPARPQPAPPPARPAPVPAMAPAARAPAPVPAGMQRPTPPPPPPPVRPSSGRAPAPVAVAAKPKTTQMPRPATRPPAAAAKKEADGSGRARMWIVIGAVGGVVAAVLWFMFFGPGKGLF